MNEEKIIETLEAFEPDDLSECAIYRNALQSLIDLYKAEKEKNKELDKYKRKYMLIKNKARERLEELENTKLLGGRMLEAYNECVIDEIEELLEEANNE